MKEKAYECPLYVSNHHAQKLDTEACTNRKSWNIFLKTSLTMLSSVQHLYWNTPWIRGIRRVFSLVNTWK